MIEIIATFLMIVLTVIFIFMKKNMFNKEKINIIIQNYSKKREKTLGHKEKIHYLKKKLYD